MIPRLYAPGTTSFSTGGLGPLPDCISCVVTEERNGGYELELQYPISGRHFSDLAEDCIIYAIPADGKDAQPFRIYKISRSISGIAVVYAEHISYMLNSIVVSPFTATSCAGTLAAFAGNAVGTCPFDFWTDKSVSGTFSVDVPKTIRSMLCGSEGSVLDVYGTGEYEFDGFTVKLYLHRGEDRGVTIKYGKNLSSLRHETDATSVYTGIAPFWKGNDESGTETIVYLPEIVVNSSHVADYASPIIKPVDFSSAWQTPPTVAQLRTRATSYVNDNEGWLLDHDIDVSFVALWQTEEYKDVAALQRVYLCDTVTVVYDKLGVSATAKVIKTTFDVLRERYTSITLGDAKKTFGQELVSDAVEVATSAATAQVNNATSMMQAAIDTATELIQGGLGGHVVINTDANGHPNEILVMDTDSVETAVNVVRINMAGIGFSSQGYNGPFSTAWTLEDAAFNASYITAGTLRANLIKVGILSDAANKNYWNMETGQLSLSASATVGGNTVASTSDVATAQTAAVNAAKDYVDGELVDYSTTAEMNTAISTSASGIRTEVSQTYATKVYAEAEASDAESAAKTYTDGLLQSYSTTTEMQSAINQSASAIQTSVSETYTTKTQFESLSVGGKNFITQKMVKTPGWSKDVFYYAWTEQTTSNFGTCLKPDINGVQMWSCLGLELVPGRTYTVSFQCRNEGSGNDDPKPSAKADVARNSDNTLLSSTYSFTPVYAWGKYSFTFTSTDAGMKDCTLRLYCNVEHSGNICFSDIQLEEGNTPTAWRPAGEDLVAEAETDASTKYSTITQTANAIATCVAKDEVISEINQTAETIAISASKISLEGYVTNNNGFSVDTNGTVTMSNGIVQSTQGEAAGSIYLRYNSSEDRNELVCFNQGATKSAFFTLGQASFHTPDGECYVTGDSYYLALLSYTGANVNCGVSLGIGTPSGWYSRISARRQGITLSDDTSVSGQITCTSFSCSGTKSRLVSTENYSDRLLYCYEMPSPIFGDLGDAVIADDGLCYVSIDPVFMETIQTHYQVFVQAYGSDAVYVTERKSNYFVVSGVPGTEFAWELKAKQIDTGSARLEKELPNAPKDNIDVVINAAEHIEEINRQRGIA